MYVMGCGDSEATEIHLHDVRLSVCEGRSKGDVIRKLLETNHFGFLWFVYSFLANRSAVPISRPVIRAKAVELVDRLGAEYDELRLAEIDLGNKYESKTPFLMYIRKNMGELVHILELYEAGGCQYLEIKLLSEHLMSNQDRLE